MTAGDFIYLPLGASAFRTTGTVPSGSWPALPRLLEIYDEVGVPPPNGACPMRVCRMRHRALLELGPRYGLASSAADPEAEA